MAIVTLCTPLASQAWFISLDGPAAGISDTAVTYTVWNDDYEVTLRLDGVGLAIDPEATAAQRSGQVTGMALYIDGTRALQAQDLSVALDQFRGDLWFDELLAQLLQGNDTIEVSDAYADAGNAGATLQAGGGDDMLQAGTGNDLFVLTAGGGSDSMADAGGTDRLRMPTGAAGDVQWIASGSDLLALVRTGEQATLLDFFSDGGAIEQVELAGTPDTPRVYALHVLAGPGTAAGTAEPDWLVSTAGAAFLAGLAGDDILQGGSEADTLCGGAGNDTMQGAAGRDILRGGTGADTLAGGSGADTLVGGAGADTFAFQQRDDLTTYRANGSGRFDALPDCSSSGGDRIDLAGIDARADKAGDQPFRFLAAAPSLTTVSKGLGLVWFDADAGLLLLSTDRDLGAEFAIRVNLEGASPHDIAHFLLL